MTAQPTAAVFELLTKQVHAALPGYGFTEIVMPNGEIQRWWTGNDESVIIKWIPK